MQLAASGTICSPSTFACLVASMLLLLPSAAFGQAPPPDPVQLDYSRVASVTCPQEAYFRHFVAARLGGHDPFTADAPRRITLAVRRLQTGAFAAKIAMFKGPTLLGEDDLDGSDCTSLVENAGQAVVSWLVPLVLSKSEPLQEAPPPEPPAAPRAPVPSAPAKPQQSEVPTEPEPPAMVAAPKPGIFEGRAGLGRALLIGLSVGGLSAGTTFALVANKRGDEAQVAQAMIVQRGGSSACNRSSSVLAGDCQRVLELRQQHDSGAVLSTGAFVVAGVSAAAAIASIWIVRTPASGIQVKPTARGAIPGLTLEGSW